MAYREVSRVGRSDMQSPEYLQGQLDAARSVNLILFKLIARLGKMNTADEIEYRAFFRSQLAALTAGHEDAPVQKDSFAHGFLDGVAEFSNRLL